MLQQFRPALTLLILLTVLTGIVYPGIITGIAQLVFPRQANGSFIAAGETIVGSELIGQEFSAPEYFWGRLSATGPQPYNASASSGSNFGPSHPQLKEAAQQRIVDTEGQVDRFLKRLQVRETRRAEVEARIAALTSPDVPLSEFDLSKRYLTIFAESGINVVGDFINKLEEGGDEVILEIPGIGRKVLADLKKALRQRGYELPATSE